MENVASRGDHRLDEFARWRADVVRFVPSIIEELTSVTRLDVNSTSAEDHSVVKRVAVTYAHLRDWAYLGCEVVELLLTEKLADVVTSLGKKNKPKTLLEKETVKEWLERAREVNQDFVLRIQFSVLRKQEGFEPEESVLTGLREDYEKLVKTLTVPCERVISFLEFKEEPLPRKRKRSPERGGSRESAGTTTTLTSGRLGRLPHQTVYVEVPTRPAYLARLQTRGPTREQLLAEEMNRAGVERGHLRERQRLLREMRRAMMDG